MAHVRIRLFRAEALALSILIAGASPIALRAQKQNSEVKRDSAEAVTVRRLEKQFENAHFAKDRAVLEKLFSPEFEGTFPVGLVLNRHEAIDALTRPEMAGSKSSHEKLTVKIIGTVAIARGQCRSVMGSRVESLDFHNVWIRRNGSWSLVSVSMTRSGG